MDILVTISLGKNISRRLLFWLNFLGTVSINIFKMVPRLLWSFICERGSFACSSSNGLTDKKSTESWLLTKKIYFGEYDFLHWASK